MFSKLRGVPTDQLDQVIDSFNEDDWDVLYPGYIEVAAHDLGDWWKPLLGLHADVDVLELLCKLYRRTQTRTPGA